MDIEVSEIRYSDIVSKLPIEFHGEKLRIPTLQEALEVLAGKKQRIIVELKEQGYEKSVVNLVREYGLEERVVFASFNFEILKRVKSIAPAFPLIAISNKYTKRIRDYAVRIGASILALRKDSITKDVVEECERRGIMVNAWVVNDFREAIRYYLVGVKIISTDYPRELSALRSNITQTIKRVLSKTTEVL